MALARTACLLAAACAAWARTAGAAVQGAHPDDAALRTIATLAPDFALAAVRAIDLDARPGLELVLVGERGEVVAYGWSGEGERGGFAPLEGGRVQLADPARSLLALGPSWSGGVALLVLSPEGARLHAWTDGKGFDAEGVLLAPRARFAMHVGRPTFAPILSDVDGDGTSELLVPRLDACELWRAQEREGRWIVRRAASVALRATHDETAEHDDLSDRVSSTFRIPSLVLRDVNGDRRDDVLVATGRTRAFHLQREDGGFVSEPDVHVDLGIFRDASGGAELAPGEIVVGNEDEAALVSEDLDGDGILDHVVTHRRKVWIFAGRATGPQFTEPARILKATEDVTAALVLDVDRDARADLVLIKVRVPRIAELVLALVSSWEVGAHVVGYENLGGLELSTTPAWERDLALELPPLLDLLRRPEQWITRLEELGERMRAPIVADLGGDGVAEVVLAKPREGELALWRPEPGEHAAELADDDESELLRKLFFEDQRTRWTAEGLLDALADRAAARLREWTSGRPPDAMVALRPPSEHVWLGALAGDFDGDGRAELCVAHELRARRGFAVIDVLAPRAK